jgi:hypothetical protein
MKRYREQADYNRKCFYRSMDGKGSAKVHPDIKRRG